MKIENDMDQEEKEGYSIMNRLTNDVITIICSFLDYQDLLQFQYINKNTYQLMNGQTSEYQVWKEYTENSMKQRLFYHSNCPRVLPFSIKDWKLVARFVHKSENECIMAKQQLTNLQADVYSNEEKKWISKSPEHKKMDKRNQEKDYMQDQEQGNDEEEEEEEEEKERMENENAMEDIEEGEFLEREPIIENDDQRQEKRLLQSWKETKRMFGYGINESSYDHQNQRVLCTSSLQDSFWSTTGSESTKTHDWLQYTSATPTELLRPDDDRPLSEVPGGHQYSIQYVYVMVIKPFDAKWLNHTIFNSKRVRLRCMEAASDDSELLTTPECPVLPLYHYQHYFLKPYLLIQPCMPHSAECHAKHATLITREIQDIEANYQLLRHNLNNPHIHAQFSHLMGTMRHYMNELKELRSRVGDFRYVIDFFDRCAIQGGIDNLYYTCYEYCNLHGAGALLSPSFDTSIK